jgi:hypothetical protein
MLMLKQSRHAHTIRTPFLPTALLGIVLIWSIASTALAVAHEFSRWLPKFGGVSSAT